MSGRRRYRGDEVPPFAMAGDSGFGGSVPWGPPQGPFPGPRMRGRGGSGGRFGESGPDFAGWGRGRRRRRGDVRAAVLALLAERPMHGYDIIRELESRSGGLWRPSPGSVYPTLQLLEDEGLVTPSEEDGKRVYALTEAGRTEADKRGHRGAPWEPEAPGEAAMIDARSALWPLMSALMQAAQVGTAEQTEAVRAVIDGAVREIYGILAQGGRPGPDEDS